jgi:hypothetical protein
MPLKNGFASEITAVQVNALPIKDTTHGLSLVDVYANKGIYDTVRIF